jgi:hypothetical protein
MTPKEKAQELFDKFNNPDRTNYPYYSHNAQQCALISVDEIIEATNMHQFAISNDKESIPTKIVNHPYWQEVKKEIEAL